MSGGMAGRCFWCTSEGGSSILPDPASSSPCHSPHLYVMICISGRAFLPLSCGLLSKSHLACPTLFSKLCILEHCGVLSRIDQRHRAILYLTFFKRLFSLSHCLIIFNRFLNLIRVEKIRWAQVSERICIYFSALKCSYTVIGCFKFLFLWLLHNNG